jgi:hypothetical protein
MSIFKLPCSIQELNSCMTIRLPYERKGHSQHTETGIIEFMLAGVHNPKKTFVEIGFGDGTENMTLDLLHLGYSGVGIDGYDWNPTVVERWPDQLIKIQEMITPRTVLDHIPIGLMTPDFFSLDIDSFDYEIAKVLLQSGFAPAVVCCEINKKFGDEWASFPYIKDAGDDIYDRKFSYGCSLSKYKDLWSKHGYEFFTVDTTAVNGFWFDPKKVTLDMTVLRHLDLGNIDTSYIKDGLASHWFWKNNLNLLYQL